jgi:hypothetical protein
MDGRRPLWDEQMRQHRALDLLCLGDAEPRSESPADHDRLEVEEIDGGCDARGKRGDCQFHETRR